MMEANQTAYTASTQIPAMPFGVMLDRVYRILRDHLKVFLGIAAVPGVAMMLLYGAVMGILFAYLWPYMAKNGTAPATPDPAVMMRIMTPAIVLATIAFMIPFLAVFAFYLAAAFHAAIKIDSGIGTSIRESYENAWSRMGRSFVLLIWIYFRAFGLALAILCAFFGAFGLLTPAGANHAPPLAVVAIFPVIMLLYFAAYVYGIIVALRLSLAFPAWMEEGLTAGEAMKRSNRFTYGSKGRIFLLLLVIYAISYACFMVVYIVGFLVFGIGALAMAALQIHPTAPWSFVAIGVAVVILLCFLYVWMALLYGSGVVTLSVVYHDQRRRMDAPLPAQLPAADAQLPPAGAEPA